MNKAAGLKMRRRLRRERRRACREAQAVKPSHSFLLACLPEDVKPWAKQLEVLDAVAADVRPLPAGYQGSGSAEFNRLLSRYMKGEGYTATFSGKPSKG